MFRRGKWTGSGLVALGALSFFLPLAGASASTRANQTLTVAALVMALIVTGAAWAALSGAARLPRAGQLGLAALAGSMLPVLLAPLAADLRDADRSVLASRALAVGLLAGAGTWMFVTGLRRAFPRANRALAGGAISLALLALLLWPSLLLQPGVEARHHISDVQLQLRAGYRYWTVGAILLIGPFLALTTLPGDWFERWWSAARQRLQAITATQFQVGIFLATLAIAIGLAMYSFDRIPTTADEIAQLWHARMLASGRLAMPPDPSPEFFAIDNMIDAPRWMSQFPIGGPAFLAIGFVAGAPWLLNPVLTALLAVTVYRFSRRAYGEQVARLAAVITATSPMVLLMGATHMNHTPTALLVLLALLLFSRWRDATTARTLTRDAALIGLALGVALTIRPLDAAIAGVVIGTPMLYAAILDRARARSLLAGVAAAAVPVALLLYVNWKTTGSPTRFGYEMLWGPNHSLGLHPDPMGTPHTPWRAVLLVVKYAVQVNWIVTAWPVPLILMVAAGLLASRRAQRWDVLLLALFGAQLLTYGFYWHDGQFVGPRFLFSVVPPLLILAARAPFVIAERARSNTVRRMAVVIIPACIGVTWLRSMPPYGGQALASEFRASRSRLKVDPPAQIQGGSVDNALVFVQEGTSTRLLRRLWGLGVSRPDAARLLATKDGCSLAAVVRAEEARPPGDTTGRLTRIDNGTAIFRPSASNLRVPDYNLRISDSTSLNDACIAEITMDYRVKNTIGYGRMLLENRFDAAGRIAGSAVYVMDLGEHNAVLRQRFGDRRWFRYQVPRGAAGMQPVLVPYDSVR